VVAFEHAHDAQRIEPRDHRRALIEHAQVL
jgi:hypothetical protein